MPYKIKPNQSSKPLDEREVEVTKVVSTRTLKDIDAYIASYQLLIAELQAERSEILKEAEKA